MLFRSSRHRLRSVPLHRRVRRTDFRRKGSDMQDIVDRLRCATHQIDHDAADEIERLRAAGLATGGEDESNGRD